MAMVSLQVSFFGRVQGVGMRMFVLTEANKSGVKGWVRNSNKEDLVEALFVGEEKKVMELIEKLKLGNGRIRVDRAVVSKSPQGEKFNTFEIKY